MNCTTTGAAIASSGSVHIITVSLESMDIPFTSGTKMCWWTFVMITNGGWSYIKFCARAPFLEATYDTNDVHVEAHRCVVIMCRRLQRG